MNTITINTLNIYLGGREAQHSPGIVAALIGSALAHVMTAPLGEHNEARETTAGAAAGTSASAATVTSDDVLAFLNSDARYALRSASAVSEAFPGAEVTALLQELVSAGKVSTKRRRSDGATLYQALVSSPVVAVEWVTPEDIADFIDDSDYSLLSRNAIAKHFADVSPDDLDRALQDGVDDDILYTRRRRSDGATLYGSNA